MQITDVARRPASSTDDDSLDHVYCCDEDTALCGADVSGLPVISSLANEDACVVCVDLERLPCERCGDW